MRLAQTRLVALQNGVVLTRSVEPGDVVQPSRTLLVMAADGDTQLVFQPDERNLAFIALGQKARASADAFPQQVFDAEVSYIAPSIDPQRGSVEVRLRVREPPPFLKPDMTVSVDLTVAAKTHALTLASDAVRGAATPSPWVFAVEGGRVVRKDVKLGIRGEGATEIVSGLDEGALGRRARRSGARQRDSACARSATDMPFEWFVALRYMRDAKAQTALILAAVSVGVSVIVFLSALINGLQVSLDRQDARARSRTSRCSVPREEPRPLVAADRARSPSRASSSLRRSGSARSTSGPASWRTSSASPA